MPRRSVKPNRSKPGNLVLFRAARSRHPAGCRRSTGSGRATPEIHQQPTAPQSQEGHHLHDASNSDRSNVSPNVTHHRLDFVTLFTKRIDSFVRNPISASVAPYAPAAQTAPLQLIRETFRETRRCWLQMQLVHGPDNLP